MKRILIPVFLACYIISFAQDNDQEIRLPKSKRLIDKVEVFVGPTLSFNYGNKFVENYEDGNIRNKRLPKIGGSFGIGVFHSLSERIEINARVQYDIKGRKTELNTPLTQNARQIDFEDYTYNYFTVCLAPRIMLCKDRKSFISLGAYYSKIKSINGYGRSYNTLDHQISEGRYKGRYFVDVRDDGTINSFTWTPGLQSFKSFDAGTIVSIGYSLTIKDNHNLDLQLIDNLGLNDINKHRPYGQVEKNHAVSFVISYTIQRSNKN